MAAVIFPFRILRAGFREFYAFRTETHEASAGRRMIQELHAGDELVVRGRLRFPQPGYTYRDFVSFWRARRGPWQAFLYKAGNPGEKAAHDDPEDVGGGNTDFPVSRRYVDTATLVVKKNGVVQTLGDHYSLVNETGGAYVLGTSTRLVVRFAVAPAGGSDLDFDFEFYFPVRFEGDEMPEDQDLEGGGFGSAAVADRTVAVAMRETGPGYNLADAPSSL